VLVPFVQPAFELVLQGQGFEGATGAEQVVPGMAVMFSFYIIGSIGYAIYREHAWNTWNRLRATGVPSMVLVLGKVSPYIAIVLLQQVLLLEGGQLVFDLRAPGSHVGVLLIAAAMSFTVAALGVLAVAVSTSIQQLNVAQGLGALALAGLGGALTPVDLLPGWAQLLAPITPSYWAMRGYRSLFLEGDGTGAALLPTAVIVGFGALFCLASSLRYRIDEAKSGAGVLTG
jgi:ABC-2 type transport system permease protein